MSTIIDPVQILKTKAHVNNTSLEVVTSNIASAEIEGATAKYVDQSSILSGASFVGVDTNAVYRYVDQNILKDMRAQNSNVNMYQSESYYYNELQSLFGTIGQESSPSALMGKFYDALTNVITQPVGTNKQSVIHKATELANTISTISNQAQELRATIDAQITNVVNDINTDLEKLNKLNSEISKYGILGEDITTLQDQFEQTLFELSSKINIEVVKENDYESSVFTSAYTPLVVARSHDYYPCSFIQSTSAAAGVTLNPVDLSNGNSILPEISSGKLYALLNLRDVVLPNLQQELDQLATVLRDQVNSAHNLGTSTNPPNTLTGTIGAIGSSTTPGVGLTAATPISGNGTLLIEVINPQNGIAVSYGTVPLTAGMTVGGLITAINAAGGANFSASLTAAGELQLQSSNSAYGIAIGSLAGTNAQMNAGATLTPSNTYGFSHFFGLNNLFDSNNILATQSSTGVSNALSVRKLYQNDSTKLCCGYLVGTTPPSTTSSAIPGFAMQSAQAMADILNDPTVYFTAAGTFVAQNTALIDYATLIASDQSFRASQSNQNLESSLLDYSNFARLKDSESGIDAMSNFTQLVQIQIAQSYTSRSLKLVLENQKEILSAVQ